MKGRMNDMKKLLILIIVLSSPLFYSCATSVWQVNSDVGAHQPHAYKEGYQGGCNSGYSAGGNIYYRFTKDVGRYSSDELYRQGWDDGFMTCKGRYDSILR
jgi:hypothetical protein